MNGVDAFLWRETGMGGAAMHDQFGLTDSLARRLQQAAWTEGRLEDEDGIAAARFGFEELAGSLAADFLVGSPKKDEPFAKRYFRLTKRLQGKEGLNDSGLHVKNSRAVGFAGGNAEWHLLQYPAGIDGVVMAEDKELARRARFARRVRNAQNIATMLLRNPFHACAVLTPFRGEDAAASIGGGFFQAGRFCLHEPAQGGKHLGKLRLQESQEFYRQRSIGHGSEMLSMPREQSNQAKPTAAKGRSSGLTVTSSLRERNGGYEQQRVSQRAEVRI